MKIIEAMKRVKQNEEKINALQARINAASVSANGLETSKRIEKWMQSCNELRQENVKLLCAIHKTNAATKVPIEIGGRIITKSIVEWLWRRRRYTGTDSATWSRMTDRAWKESNGRSSPEERSPIRIDRYYDPMQSTGIMAVYRSEPHLIDAALEGINATTELIEA